MTTNNDNNLSEWRGYVVRALEDICKDIIENKDKLSGLEEKLLAKMDKMAELFNDKMNEVDKVLSSHRSKLASLSVKAGLWGTIGGLISLMGAIGIALLIHRITKS